MHSFEFHSNESESRKSGRLGMEQVMRQTLPKHLRIFLKGFEFMMILANGPIILSISQKICYPFQPYSMFFNPAANSNISKPGHVDNFLILNTNSIKNMIISFNNLDRLKQLSLPSACTLLLNINLNLNLTLT